MIFQTLTKSDLTNNGDLGAFGSKRLVTPAPDAEKLKAPAKRENVARSTTDQRSEKAEYAAKLRNIIQKARLCQHLDELDETPSNQKANPPQPATKLEKTIAAFMETFFYFKIPATQINACFLAAKAERIRVGNETGFFPKLEADFIAAQWLASVKEKFETLPKNRRLGFDRAALANCPKCFGNSSGREYDENGIRGRLTGKICLHEDLIFEDE